MSNKEYHTGGGKGFSSREFEQKPKENERMKKSKWSQEELAKELSSLASQAYPDDNPKTVMGMAKPPLSAIPPTALIHLGQAMADGRNKYGQMNWRTKQVTSSIYYDAAMRHLLAWWDGENNASDSKVHHLGHAMACLAIVLDAESVGMLKDDRSAAGRFSAEVAQRTTGYVMANKGADVTQEELDEFPSKDWDTDSKDWDTNR